MLKLKILCLENKYINLIFKRKKLLNLYKKNVFLFFMCNTK